MFVTVPAIVISASLFVPASSDKFWPTASPAVTAAKSIFPVPVPESITAVIPSAIVVRPSISNAPVPVMFVVFRPKVPVTFKLSIPVTVSVPALPNTALPVTVILSAVPPLPATVPRNVIVVPLNCISASPERTALPV